MARPLDEIERQIKRIDLELGRLRAKDLQLYDRIGNIIGASGNAFSLVGPLDGDKGDTGVAGDTGAQGDTGVAGVDGDTGIQGDTGVFDSPSAQGSMVIADATPEWSELLIGNQYTHLESDGSTADWQANITMADTSWIGRGPASPRMVFGDSGNELGLYSGATLGLYSDAGVSQTGEWDASDGDLTLYSDLIFNNTDDGIIHPSAVQYQLLVHDGTRFVPAWMPALSIAQHAILSTHHSDVVTGYAVAQGALIYGDSTPQWTRLNVGSAYQFLMVNGAGTLPSWTSFDWDLARAAAGADMAHDHSTAAEGGEIPLTSLGSWLRGRLVIGGTTDWTTLGIGSPYDVLRVNSGGTDPAWSSLFDATVPNTIEPDDVALAGTATAVAHRDHEHAIVCAAPAATLTEATANAEGSATSFARSDHTHDIDVSATRAPHDAQYVVLAVDGELSAERVLTAGDGIDQTDGGAGSTVTLAVDVTDILGSGLTESSNNIDLNWGTPTIGTIECDDPANAGTGTNPARSDHQHAIVCAAPGADSVNVAASAEGSAASFARSNHTHNLDESIAAAWTGQHYFSNTLNALTDLSNPSNYHIIVRNPADDTGEMAAIGFYISVEDNDVGGAIGFYRTGAETQGELRFYTKRSTGEGVDPVVALTLTQEGYGEFAGRVGINQASPVAWLDIEAPAASTIPAIHLDAEANGEIVVPDSTSLRMGHYNSGTTTFTERFRLDGATGDLIFASGTQLQVATNTWIGIGSGSERITFQGTGDTVQVAGGCLQITGAGTPAAGSGLVMEWDGSTSDLLSYNYTGGSYLPIRMRGSVIQMVEGATVVTTIDGGNLGLKTTSWGGGVGVFGVANAGTAPTSNPSGGGLLYAQAGAGKWRGSSGTITTFGPAEPHCPICGRDFVLEWQNPDTGHLIVCMWCLSEGLESGVVKRDNAA